MQAAFQHLIPPAPHGRKSPGRYATLRANNAPHANARARIGVSLRARRNFSGGDSVNFDPNNRLPDSRPSREHWGPKVNKAVEGIKPPEPKPVKTVTGTGGGGKGAAAIKGLKAIGAAMQEMFPPPPNLFGLHRPGIYIGSMSIGGKKPDPE
jgi:hypothetical protein